MYVRFYIYDWLMKKLFIMIAILLSSVSITFAANTDWDCVLVLSKTRILSVRDENNEGLVNLVKAMPKEAMEKAFDNLNKYCCDVKTLSENCGSTNDNTLYPESVYIFDHILDIYLRRLDAKDNLLYGLSADSSWQEWREFIIEHGNDVNGSKPIEIKAKYDVFWTWNRNIVSFADNDSKTKDNWESGIETQIGQYDSWTLRDKYNLACDVANYISEYKYINGKWLTQSEYNLCKNLTDNRIDHENTYVQTILMQKANKLLWANMKSYLGTYFVSKKLSDLEQILFDINTSFSEVNRWVTKLIPQCS